MDLCKICKAVLTDDKFNVYHPIGYTFETIKGYVTEILSMNSEVFFEDDDCVCADCKLALESIVVKKRELFYMLTNPNGDASPVHLEGDYFNAMSFPKPNTTPKPEAAGQLEANQTDTSDVSSDGGNESDEDEE